MGLYTVRRRVHGWQIALVEAESNPAARKKARLLTPEDKDVIQVSFGEWSARRYKPQATDSSVSQKLNT